MKLSDYLSCFGPQFVRGLGSLATKSNGKLQRFTRVLWPIPDFNQVPHTALTLQGKWVIRSVWLAIGIAWVSMIYLLIDLWHSLLLWAGIALLLSVLAPFALMFVAVIAFWFTGFMHKKAS